MIVELMLPHRSNWAAPRHATLAVPAPPPSIPGPAALAAEPRQVLLLGGGLAHPVSDPIVELIAPRCRARLHPELVVLAVAVDGHARGVEPAGVGAHRCLGHREDAVGRQLHEMGPRP